MRFTAPPTWPAAPTGWEPPAGWSPDATWPPAPAGWSFWSDAAGAPLPVLRTDVPAWDRAAVLPTGAQDLPRTDAPVLVGAGVTAGATAGGTAGAVHAGPTVPGYGPAGPSLPAEEPDGASAARSARRRALGLFAAGVVVFLAGAGTTIAAERSATGGYLWTGGMIFGAVLLVRALVAYRGTRGAGVPVRPLSVVAVAVGLLLCTGGAATALVSAVENASMPEDTGSCWTAQDEENLVQVPCSRDHDMVVVATVTDEADCPAEAFYLVELDDTHLGCLADD